MKATLEFRREVEGCGERGEYYHTVRVGLERLDESMSTRWLTTDFICLILTTYGDGCFVMPFNESRLSTTEASPAIAGCPYSERRR